MTVHYQDATVTLHHGDCLDVLRTLPDNSVDSVVTDPPYGLEFMGKDWDAPWAQHFTSIGAGAPLPDRQLHVNPRCKTCRGYQRGTKNKCECPSPQWNDSQAAAVARKNVGFQQWCELWAAECLRALKPGGHMLAFGGTRTWHRLACAVEDAGFEVRDSIAWLYGSGFPKSLDVSKAIDARATVNEETKRRTALVAEVIRTHREAKGMERAAVSLAVVGTPSGACWNWEHQQLPSIDMWPAIKATLGIPDEFDGLIAGDRAQFIAAERAVLGERKTGIGTGRGAVAYIADSENRDITAPATADAQQWQGWGTALKPAFEPIVVARKPLAGTVARNILTHGTGALNIDGCRTEVGDADPLRSATYVGSNPGSAGHTMGDGWADQGSSVPTWSGKGRWPANVVLDESQSETLDEQSGTLASGKMLAGTKPKGERETYGRDAANGYKTQRDTPGDVGGASRFFYVAKADASERPRVNGTAHPTVKPIALMRWLVRLVTPPDGTVLEPFAGSGTTVEACIVEGFHVVAIEREADYLPLIVQRINRRRDPIAYTRTAGEDLGLFDLGEETA